MINVTWNDKYVKIWKHHEIIHYIPLYGRMPWDVYASVQVILAKKPATHRLTIVREE